MANIRQYYDAIAATTERLPLAPMYYLTSLDTPDGGKAGRVVDIVERKEAAKLLVANSHRISTPEEVQQFHDDLKMAEAERAAKEVKSKMQFAMPAEMTQLLAALANQGEQKTKKEKP